MFAMLGVVGCASKAVPLGIQRDLSEPRPIAIVLPFPPAPDGAFPDISMSNASQSQHLTLPVIPSLDERASTVERQHIQRVIDGKTKPLGALGSLESLMMLFASSAVARGDSVEQPLRAVPRMLVFAGDHGVARKGVSIAGSEVTTAMVRNFLAGGAAISVVARQHAIPLEVVDCGICVPVEPQPGLIDCRLGAGTAAFDETVAMSIDSACQGIAHGMALARDRVESGMNVLCVGEMGIGNTSAAAALMSALTNIPVDECVGKGTGIDDATLAHKREIIARGVALHRQGNDDTPLELAARLGGYELVVMTGAMLGAAEKGALVLVDGFVSSVAACLGCQMVPSLRDYVIFTHLSEERGHLALLNYLGARPAMQLELRIGEGVGSALAVPLLESALACYNQMASFADAGISL